MAGHPDTLVPSGSLRALRELLPYLWPVGEWRMRTRVVLALAMLAGSKITLVFVPVLFGRAVDALGGHGVATAAALPIGLILA